MMSLSSEAESIELRQTSVPMLQGTTNTKLNMQPGPTTEGARNRLDTFC